MGPSYLSVSLLYMSLPTSYRWSRGSRRSLQDDSKNANFLPPRVKFLNFSLTSLWQLVRSFGGACGVHWDRFPRLQVTGFRLLVALDFWEDNGREVEYSQEAARWIFAVGLGTFQKRICVQKGRWRSEIH